MAQVQHDRIMDPPGVGDSGVDDPAVDDPETANSDTAAAAGPPLAEPVEDVELLVEDVSIDGMCGVY